ncbi:MAG: outer membrane protein assembly factor BamD [Planctomycetia bacterium]|nr:outer membrane protein assembly factor BamD [Planctomycetia bacterium]
MDARRISTFWIFGITAVAVTACRAPVGAAKDPFTSVPQAAANAAQAPPGAPTAGPPKDGVAQASYSDATPNESSPGVSIQGAQLEEGKPSFWERTAKTFSSANIKSQYKKLIGKAPDEALAKKLYNEADELFRAQKYNEAASKFEDAGERWPDSLLEEDALYMQGESLFFADRYHGARNAFDTLLKKYTNSRHLDRITARQFLIGRFWEQAGRDSATFALNFTDKTRPWFDTKGNGIKVYETIRLSDPTGPLADDALMAQATSYFMDNRFEDSAYHYEILRKDYVQSEHVTQAHLLGLQSYMNAYQGPQYDVMPLKKAETLADQTIRIYGGQLPAERPRLQQAKELVRAQIAEREYGLGEYYRRLDYNRAARVHYANVIRDFPDTRFAELAQQQITATENLLPEPPDYFPWLTRMLGRDRQN